jgi:hypothetical protein
VFSLCVDLVTCLIQLTENFKYFSQTPGSVFIYPVVLMGIVFSEDILQMGSTTVNRLLTVQEIEPLVCLKRTDYRLW